MKRVRDLKIIPGIGPKLKQRLITLGYYDVESLKGVDPMNLYEQDCAYSKGPVDRCVLYCYRLATDFANCEETTDYPYQWWDFKDKS